MEQNHFSNFGTGSSKEHSCKIILESAHWPRRRCRLKGFSILKGYCTVFQHALKSLEITGIDLS